MSRYHILYINLDRDAVRAEKLISNLNQYFDDGSATFERVRGVEVTEEEAKSLIDRQYHHERAIKRGEVGCALAHVKAWKRVVELGHPCIILEDDVISHNHNFLRDLDKLNAPTTRIYAPEFVYLGRQPHKYAAEESYMDFRVPLFSWLLHAYWITPSGAQKLLDTGFEKNISVVDDYVPVMLNDGPYMQFTEQYRHAPKLKALAFEKALFWQEDPIGPERLAKSRTENSPTIQHKSPDKELYGLVTVGTDPENPGMKMLEASLDLNSWTYASNVGGGSEWRSEMQGKDGAMKLHLMKKFLDHLHRSNTDPETIIIFVDAYDVFVQESPVNIVRKFLRVEEEGKVIFAAETNMWPERDEPIPANRGQYLNSGCYIGRLKNMDRLFDELTSSTVDDQEYMQNVWVAHPDWITLDYNRDIFYCMADQADTELFDGMLRLKGRKDVISFIHGNGGPSIKARWMELAKIYVNSHGPDWIGPRPTS